MHSKAHYLEKSCSSPNIHIAENVLRAPIDEPKPKPKKSPANARYPEFLNYSLAFAKGCSLDPGDIWPDLHEGQSSPTTISLQSEERYHAVLACAWDYTTPVLPDCSDDGV